MNKNVLMFVTGFCVYITIEVLFHGYSYPLMGIIAGFAVIILDKINDRISWDVDLLLQSLCGSALITFSELVIGTISKMGYLPEMWNYDNMPLNYNGIICVPFSLIWMLLSCVAIFVADAINYYVYEELPVPYYKIFGKKVIEFKEKTCKL